MTPYYPTAEQLYRIAERTGLNCGTERATKEQQEQIKREVTDDMKRLELNKMVEGWGV